MRRRLVVLLARPPRAVSSAAAQVAPLPLPVTWATTRVRSCIVMSPVSVRQRASIVSVAPTPVLAKDAGVHTLRLEGPNRLGLGAKIAGAVADAGINMRGLSGTALGRRCAIYLAFDTSADAEKARRILKRAFTGK